MPYNAMYADTSNKVSMHKCICRRVFSTLIASILKARQSNRRVHAVADCIRPKGEIVTVKDAHSRYRARKPSAGRRLMICLIGKDGIRSNVGMVKPMRTFVPLKIGKALRALIMIQHNTK